MHDHDSGNTNDGHKGMMWMMAICCGLPILLILVFGAGGKAFGAPTGVIFVGVAIMLAVHFFAMSGSHKHVDEKKDGTVGEADKKENKDSKTNSDHGCCH